ncbi:hypothetical protein CANCADRAFT_17260, partial [Tortispora caseinolytica NRRL Y-17796]
PRHLVKANQNFDLLLRFPLDGHNTTLKLALEPNAIISQPIDIEIINDGGAIVTQKINPMSVKTYKGAVFAKEPQTGYHRVGWTRITVHKDGSRPSIQGSFSAYGIEYTIAPKKFVHDLPLTSLKYADDDLLVWSDGDRLFEPQSPDTLFYDAEIVSPFDPINVPSRFDKRQSVTNDTTSGYSGGVNLTTVIGSTAGCPSARKIALVGIVTDCNYASAFNNNPDDIRSHVVSLINTASTPYENAFNIALGLKSLVISNASCPSDPPANARWNRACSDGITLSDRLDDFGAWRTERSGDGMAVWTLMTTCTTDSSVGLSWLGMLCRSTSEGSSNVSGCNIVARTNSEWQVIAHEIGHTFGAVHDCTADTCAQNLEYSSQCCPLSASVCNANSQFIMNPSTSSTETVFSQCTVGNVCSALGRNMVNSSCLLSNRQVELESDAVCGNGIVEVGEECDCGDDASCASNPCCDSATCRFKNGAVCDDTNDTCCTNCQFASNTTICRASLGPCDPAEYCPGNAAACPSDQTLPDGETCTPNSTESSRDTYRCASGQCTSRNAQCRSVVAPNVNLSSSNACDDYSCVITCFTYYRGSNVCVNLNQNFLDGTVCGGSGRCRSGRCIGGGGILGGGSDFFDRNRGWLIALAAVGGVLLILLVTSIFWKSCRASKTPKNMPAPHSPGQGYPLPTGPYEMSNFGGSPQMPPPAYNTAMNYPGVP